MAKYPTPSSLASLIALAVALVAAAVSISAVPTAEPEPRSKAQMVPVVPEWILGKAKWQPTVQSDGQADTPVASPGSEEK